MTTPEKIVKRQITDYCYLEKKWKHGVPGYYLPEGTLNMVSVRIIRALKEGGYIDIKKDD